MLSTFSYITKSVAFVSLLLVVIASSVEAFIIKKSENHGHSFAYAAGAPEAKRGGINMSRSSKTSDEDTSGDDKIKSKTWNPLRLAVMKLGLTEPAWTSPWNYQKKEGTFVCAYCGEELFESNAKYDSGSGWPSFWRTASDGSVALKMEWDGRMECKCQRCKSHLGHVFLDGPMRSSMPQSLVETIPQTDARGTNFAARLPRYCINGAALRFDEKKES
jgi:peptide-methionine (R)-S-oxide reductase